MRTFDCIENDETSHVESDESTPKRLKLQEPSVMKYAISTDSKMKAQVHEHTAPTLYTSIILFSVISHPQKPSIFIYQATS